MSGLIPQQFVENLLDRIDLAELIGSRITLKKAGANYKACCPFHDEKTPSFNVRPDKGFYHCFGCGAHGDAISFVREFEGLGFTEAVEELAKRVGLEVPYDRAAKQEIQQARTLTDALDFASRFYQSSLRVSKAPMRGTTCSNGAWTTASSSSTRWATPLQPVPRCLMPPARICRAR